MTSVKTNLGYLSLLAASAFAASPARAGAVHVEVFSAKEANVNAFVFSDSLGTVIVDTTRNSKEARELARLARAKSPNGEDPKMIFITHGHPDHYLGMGALRAEFPNARIVVASRKVKDDIIGFTKFMESVKWLEGEPGMKIRSPANPNGFDYEKEIHILEGNRLVLPGGSALEIQEVAEPTEAADETLLYSRELNSVFASDLVYNQVHLWLGVGVTPEAIQNWKENLARLKARYEPEHATIYPGHGPEGTTALFDATGKYMDDLLSVVRESGTEEEAKSKMVRKYPDWKNADFLLAQSIKFQFENRPGGARSAAK